MAKTSKGINRSSKILLLLAMIVACFVGWGTYTLLNRQHSTVYLYAQDYPMGTKIQSNMFLSSELDTALYNAAAQQGTYYATADDINGFIQRGDALLADVVGFTPVTNNQISSSGGTGTENRLAKDMVSVALPADTVNGMPDDLRIGSRLNITTGYSIDTTRETDLIFQNMLVLDVTRDSSGFLETAYVEVDPAESVKLIHALTFERVWATVLKPRNYKPVSGDDTSYSRVYSNNNDDSSVITIAPNASADGSGNETVYSNVNTAVQTPRH